ncbi:MAG: D-alanyl-D-alanine carboxypeptidase [Clostridia bacterium]|nr:D-alanyl-D-alanine carboxypeptidase [Clostridia bacterium]
MLKKITNIAALSFAILLIILSFSNYYSVSAESKSAEIAVELSTGRVLKENNADTKLPMASTTKIMTALLVAEDCNLDEVVTVPDIAVGVEGSSVYLKKGEEIDVKDLLYGLMLRSGNDCAVALAVTHSGSVNKFVERMNAKAAELGANNTNFVNPSGLPDDNHYTTARDLAVIACAAMNNSVVREVVATKNYKGKYRSYSNKNKMLYNYDGANGIKTGYTVKAGRCLVSSAKRNGMDVVCVVLNCPDMYERSINILDFCFNNFELKKLSANNIFMCGDVLCKIKKDTNIVVKKNVKVDYKAVPYKESKGGNNDCLIGKIQFYQQKSLIFEENLYSIVSR